MSDILMYTTKTCPYCEKARILLRKKNLPYTEIFIDEFPEKRDEMMAKSQRKTVPQIFINGRSIGGSDDLHTLEEQGQLDKLLQGTNLS